MGFAFQRTCPICSRLPHQASVTLGLCSAPLSVLLVLLHLFPWLFSHASVSTQSLALSKCSLQVGLRISEARSCCGPFKFTHLSGLTQVYYLVHQSLLHVLVILLGSSPQRPARRSRWRLHHPVIVPSRTLHLSHWRCRRINAGS